MSEIESTRTVKCDNCGQVKTYKSGVKKAEDGWANSLMSLSLEFASTYIGGSGPDYCSELP